MLRYCRITYTAPNIEPTDTCTALAIEKWNVALWGPPLYGCTFNFFLMYLTTGPYTVLEI